MRLFVGLLSGVATALLLPADMGAGARLVGGWDVGALLVAALCWSLILNESPDRTKQRAAADDPGRHVVWFIVLFSSAASLFAATVVLRQARQCAPQLRDIVVGLCLFAVGIAWALTHTSYALRYAHLYYRGESVGGLEFPGNEPPGLMDFAYFAFTIGMCFQVSDVTISARRLRRTVLSHSLLAFAYNTTILALALNLVAGLFG